MKAILPILLFGILFSTTTYSQKDFSKYISSVNIGDSTVQVLRVPPDELSGNMLKQYVFSVQAELDRQREFYQEGESIEFGSRGKVEMSCRSIQKEDPTFPTHYYRAELKALLAWDEAAEKRQIEKNNALIKAYNDSIHLKNLKGDYKWINAAFVIVREAPDAKADSIGKLYRLSYVHAYKVVGKDDWAEIDFGSHKGFILKSDIANEWEKMNLVEDELETLKSGRYYDFEPTITYKAKLDKAAAAKERMTIAMKKSIPKRTYYTGPRGGCYYLDANGYKQYVDRGFCK